MPLLLLLLHVPVLISILILHSPFSSVPTKSFFFANWVIWVLLLLLLRPCECVLWISNNDDWVENMSRTTFTCEPQKERPKWNWIECQSGNSSLPRVKAREFSSVEESFVFVCGNCDSTVFQCKFASRCDDVGEWGWNAQLKLSWAQRRGRGQRRRRQNEEKRKVHSRNCGTGIENEVDSHIPNLHR